MNQITRGCLFYLPVLRDVQPATIRLLNVAARVNGAERHCHTTLLKALKMGLVRRRKDNSPRGLATRTQAEILGFDEYRPVIGPRPYLYELTPAGETIADNWQSILDTLEKLK